MRPWTFVHAADIQVGSPKSFRWAPAWKENWEQAKKQILEIRPDLMLVGGDITRDGSIHRYELEDMKADFNALPFPVHVVPGNMDTGNKHTRVSGTHRRDDTQMEDLALNVNSHQLQQFRSVFGPLWWSFLHKGVRFSGFVDMVVNSGLPEEDAFWHWAEDMTRLPPERHHVWVLHYPLFADKADEPDWDITVPEQYQDWYFTIDQPGRARLIDLFKRTSADIVISGHVHCHKVHEVDGIRFEIAPAVGFPQWPDRWPDGDATLGFMRYDVSDGGIECSVIPLEKTSHAKGYGPGGHPAPHARDYSIAWDKSARRS